MADLTPSLVTGPDGKTYRLPPFMTQADVGLLAHDFPVRDNDIFIATYLKAGTTWMQQIVQLLINGGAQGDVHLSQAIPWIEGLFAGMYGGTTRLFAGDQARRAFHTHLPYNLLPVAPHAKYIYVARNPKDVAVSYFYFARNFAGIAYDGTWDEFFDAYIQGTAYFGSVFEHVQAWWQASQEADNILFVTYEAMKASLSDVTAEVADFLEIPHDDAFLAHVVAQSSFAAMSKNPLANGSWLEQRADSPGHLRKGIVGDWRAHFSAEQHTRFEDAQRQAWAGTELPSLFADPMPAQEMG